MAVALRLLLLFDDPWAHGYDGWYYVLQVRSLQAGTPLFADQSLVFKLLVLLAQATGDPIVGNKLAAAGFAGVTAAAGSVLGRRWLGSWTGALALGMWWAVSPLHLGVSAEFLKNAAGLAVLAVLLSVLPRAVTHRRAVAAAVLLGLLGLVVHKLTAMMGLVAGLGVWLAHGLSGRRPPRWLWGAVLIAVLAVGSVGLLRMADLQRFWMSNVGTMSRWSAFWSTRLTGFERVELAAGLVAPAVLAVGAWRRPEQRAVAVSLLGLSLIALAPGLPFGWDELSWRLMLMGFVGVGAALAMVVSALPRTAVGVLGVALALVLAVMPSQLAALQSRGPDYRVWAEVAPTLQAAVPPDHRVVSHRGVCGFIWAEMGRHCENFQPPPPHAEWWRVVYGFGPQHFASHRQPDEPEAVTLMAGYTLVWEPHWQRFVAAEEDRFLLIRDPRNPFRPRPEFVYGPGGGPPVEGAASVH